MIRPQLNDLRLLKLAEMYETAFERFVLALATREVQDETVRAELLRLVSPEDRHPERIRAHIGRLRAGLGPEDAAGWQRAAIQDIEEVERAARDFYLAHAEEAYDVEVADLFRRLAHEEERHVRLAEAARRLFESRQMGQKGRPEPEEFERIRLIRTPDMPLFEGVSDLPAASADEKRRRRARS